MCVWRSLCISVQPSLKSSVWLNRRKWLWLPQEMRRGNRRDLTSLDALEPQDKTQRGRWREGQRVDRKRDTGSYCETSDLEAEERKDLKWRRDRRKLGPRLWFSEAVWRWLFSSELRALCSAAPCPPHSHWILLGRTSATVSGTVQLYLHSRLLSFCSFTVERRQKEPDDDRSLWNSFFFPRFDTTAPYCLRSKCDYIWFI